METISTGAYTVTNERSNAPKYIGTKYIPVRRHSLTDYDKDLIELEQNADDFCHRNGY